MTVRAACAGAASANTTSTPIAPQSRLGSVRRVAVLASASGPGKSTLGRRLTDRLDVPFVELDALVHGPNWTETPDQLRRTAIREPLWSGNRETLWSAIGGPDSVIFFALRSHVRRRRTWPAQLARYPITRLRTPADVERWIANV